MQQSDLLSAQNLTIGYGIATAAKVVHRALCFELEVGKVTSLLGLNGAGKSTLLRTLAAMQPPLSGTVLLHNIPLQKYSNKSLACEMGVVLTTHTGVGGLTLRELVSLGRYPHTNFMGRLTTHDHAIVNEAMQAVGVLHKADSYVAQLSDGEKQKALIAKALAQESPLLILDEPTAFLDIVSRIEIMTLLRRISKEKGLTILLSTHDFEQALLLSDNLWLLSREQGLICGQTEELLLDGSVNTLFNRDHIEFDPQTTAFRPTPYTPFRIYPQLPTPLYFAFKSLLLRHGISMVHDPLQATHFLTATTLSDIEVTDKTVTEHFESITQFVAWITAITASYPAR